jgi:hypothetical protein
MSATWNNHRVEERDLTTRATTYRLFVELGRAPTAAEVARSMGVSDADLQAAWRRLHEDHALVLNAGMTEVRMANPFSAVPSAHRVHANGRWWYANCAWDAFGICAALHTDGRVHTSCPDCGESINVRIRGRRADGANLVFHCLVPAASWWDDIAFT